MIKGSVYTHLQGNLRAYGPEVGKYCTLKLNVFLPSYRCTASSSGSTAMDGQGQFRFQGFSQIWSNFEAIRWQLFSHSGGQKTLPFFHFADS